MNLMTCPLLLQSLSSSKVIVLFLSSRIYHVTALRSNRVTTKKLT